MTGRTIPLTLLTLLWPALLPAADLSGTWRGDDGGTYYLTQTGDTLYWYGEADGENPAWANVFTGTIRKGHVQGRWVDVPKGETRGRGALTLRIDERGRLLTAVRKTGGFGGSRWRRAGARSDRTPPARLAEPTRPQPMRAAPRVREECVSFDPKSAALRRIEGRWKIVDGSHWLFDFGGNREEARAALRVIRHYKANRSCFVGRPDPSLTYLLVSGRAPHGAMRREDCVSFNPDRATVERLRKRWKIVDGSHWLFDFGDRRAEARTALGIIQKHRFTRSCFVGRPDPSFRYLRR